MSVITGAIGRQNYELVRDRIGGVLQDELDTQWQLTYDNNLDAVVYIEHGVRFDHTQIPAVNVSLSSGLYSGKDQTQVDGTYTYNIDCYAKADSTSETDGSSIAAFRVHRLMGVVRAILENPKYNSLGFDKPFNCRVSVDQIDVEHANIEDTYSTIMGRIQFTVKVPETVELVTPNLIDGYDTSVKMGLTERGYRFSGNNAPIPDVYDDIEALEIMDIYQWD
jgi:hypothetical protein